MEYIKALTIAGSDSGGGAGIQADIKTMSALGVYACSVITAVTAQNTVGVTAVHTVPPEIISAQIKAVMDDIRPEVVKIGMLADIDTMKSVSEALSCYDVRIVLDPVMVATSGDSLMKSEALEGMVRYMLPMATLITPNIPEAETLAGLTISDGSDIDEAAKRICGMGVAEVLIKGGHLKGSIMTDRYYRNGELIRQYTSDAVETRNTHGTGCTLSSAIASYIARGYDTAEAIRLAKIYISQAIYAGADVVIGNGHGPVNHFFNPKSLIKE